MREFLQKCPSCGSHFSVRLQSRKLVDVQSGTERITHEVVVPSLDPGRPSVNPASVTYEDVPIEREEFDVTFEGHHCHHTWTEKVRKVQKG